MSDRTKQFKRDFFEEHHGFRGNGPDVEYFARIYRSEFELYFARRREAAVARKAAATAARHERRCVREAAAVAAVVAAKALRDKRLVARAASATALALAAKVEKMARASSIAPGASRSQAAHEALQQERRIRKNANRVAAAVLKQTRKVAAVFVGRVIEAGFCRVASRLVSAGDVREASHSPIHPCRVGRFRSLKSKTMPRRKLSARKSGSSK